MISRSLPVIFGFAVLLASGLAHGIWTQRWQPSGALDQASARVAEVPSNAGEWQGTTLEVDAEQFRATRATAWWTRRYDKAGVSGPITVILMCGRADHMAVHTPDVCYRGAGFEMVGRQARETIAIAKEGAGMELWTARFRQPAKAASPELRIYWTWSADGSWRAPTAPRWTFGGESFLYKLYVAYEFTGQADGDAAMADFLRQLLPGLEKSLFSGKLP